MVPVIARALVPAAIQNYVVCEEYLEEGIEVDYSDLNSTFYILNSELSENACLLLYLSV
ncbi:MAG: hypothetical protein NC033_01535 [Clostridiales bacterium]|nr:hypothetical protein [Clostridiales bacterium]